MIEKFLERLLFACRWLLAPMYLGLSLALVALGIKFFQEAFHVVVTIGTLGEDQLVLIVLTLIDIVLVGSLIVMVMFSGYENFVSKLDISNTVDRPTWMGTVDFADLKMKLIASIVAISGIFLLKQFMEIGNNSTLDSSYLMWLVIIHLTFVCSGVLLALMDWIAAKSKKR